MVSALEWQYLAVSHKHPCRLAHVHTHVCAHTHTLLLGNVSSEKTHEYYDTQAIQKLSPKPNQKKYQSI